MCCPPTILGLHKLSSPWSAPGRVLVVATEIMKHRECKIRVSEVFRPSVYITRLLLLRWMQIQNSEERSIWKKKFENTFHLPLCHRNTKDIFFRESGEFSNLSDCLHQSGWVWVKALFKTIQGFVRFNRGREEFIKGSFNFSKTYFEYWECPGVWAGLWESRFLT